MILQPLYTYVYYSQVYYIRHSIKSLYKTPLHYHYFIVFLKLPVYPQLFNLVNPIPFI